MTRSGTSKGEVSEMTHESEKGRGGGEGEVVLARIRELEGEVRRLLPHCVTCSCYGPSVLETTGTRDLAGVLSQ